MLRVDNLSYQIRLKNITVQFTVGTLNAVLGDNGSGKTTFLKTLCHILKPTQGSIFYQEMDLNGLTRQEISQCLTFVPQNPPIAFDYTVEEFVNMGRYGKKKSPSIIQEALLSVDGLEFLKRPLEQLSQGERQRIYIARALATEASVILFDEPTAHLDRKHQKEIWLLMRKLADQGKTVLVANHDFDSTQKFCDTALLLEKGIPVASGKPEIVCALSQG